MRGLPRPKARSAAAGDVEGLGPAPRHALDEALRRHPWLEAHLDGDEGSPRASSGGDEHRGGCGDVEPLPGARSELPSTLYIGGAWSGA